MCTNSWSSNGYVMTKLRSVIIPYMGIFQDRFFYQISVLFFHMTSPALLLRVTGSDNITSSLHHLPKTT